MTRQYTMDELRQIARDPAYPWYREPINVERLLGVIEAAEPFLDHACTCACARDVLCDQDTMCAVCLLKERFAALGVLP